MKKLLKLFFVYLLLLVFGFLIGFGFARLNLPVKNPFALTGFLVMLLWFLPALFLTVFFHELGHLILGLLTGYEFVSFRVLNRLIKKENDKLVIKKFSLKGTLGQCLLLPTEKSLNQSFWYNFGGVFFNLIIFFSLIPLLFFVKSNLLFLPLLFTVVLNLLFAYINWAKTPGLTNDGNNYRELKKHPTSKASYYQLLRINHLLSNGDDLRNVEFTIAEDSLDLSKNIQVNYAMFLVLYYHLTFQMDKAKTLVDSIETNYPHKQSILGSMWLANKHFQDYYFEVAEKTEDKRLKLIFSDKNTDPGIALFHFYITYLNTGQYPTDLDELFQKNLKNSPNKGVIEPYLAFKSFLIDDVIKKQESIEQSI